MVSLQLPWNEHSKSTLRGGRRGAGRESEAQVILQWFAGLLLYSWQLDSDVGAQSEIKGVRSSLSSVLCSLKASCHGPSCCTRPLACPGPCYWPLLPQSLPFHSYRHSEPGLSWKEQGKLRSSMWEHPTTHRTSDVKGELSWEGPGSWRWRKGRQGLVLPRENPLVPASGVHTVQTAPLLPFTHSMLSCIGAEAWETVLSCFLGWGSRCEELRAGENLEFFLLSLLKKPCISEPPRFCFCTDIINFFFI